MAARLAFGFRAHSGWATAVVVAGSLSKPLVLERRRIVMADPAMPGYKQPFHAAEPLNLPEAESLIRQCQSSSTHLATAAVGAMAGYDLEVTGAAILLGSGRPLPSSAATLKSHALIHTSEGEFFRQVLIRACESCSLAVTKVSERGLWDRGAGVFGFDPELLQKRITEIGKPLGPPWRVDEKMASVAAWISLAER